MGWLSGVGWLRWWVVERMVVVWGGERMGVVEWMVGGVGWLSGWWSGVVERMVEWWLRGWWS